MNDLSVLFFLSLITEKGRRVGNVAFSDDGWLYVCADDLILRVKTKLTVLQPKARL